MKEKTEQLKKPPPPQVGEKRPRPAEEVDSPEKVPRRARDHLEHNNPSKAAPSQ